MSLTSSCIHLDQPPTTTTTTTKVQLAYEHRIRFPQAKTVDQQEANYCTDHTSDNPAWRLEDARLQEKVQGPSLAQRQPSPVSYTKQNLLCI